MAPAVVKLPCEVRAVSEGERGWRRRMLRLGGAGLRGECSRMSGRPRAGLQVTGRAQLEAGQRRLPRRLRPGTLLRF